MGRAVAYVRVSTEDQVEYSPDAQAARCRDYAQVHGVGALELIKDEGFSGKNLERPGMRRLLALVDDDLVSEVVVWRLDRLSRDVGDLNELIRRFERHCVDIHSVNEGRVDLATAAGRMQVGIHGVFAQFYREHVVENVHMGMRQAAEAGRWLNRAPTGYRMQDALLVPGELAPIVRRVFEPRAAGVSLAEIEAQVGIGYSTVRHIVGNRVYLGQVRLRDEWFPGIHEPLVSAELFEAAARAHLPGRRRGRDLLSGRVRCGLCGRVATVDYNERGQALYKCKHRGQGCGQPARSARGLCRAALLGLRVVTEDVELQEAIRDELDALFDGEQEERRAAEREASLTSLRQKQRKLLDLHYEDRISAEAFGTEEARIAAQIRALDADAALAAAAAREREERFNEVVDVLTTTDVEELWDAATAEERRVLVEDLVEAVSMFPDHLEVKVGGAPPLLVELGEVGLRDPGTRSSVSEGGLSHIRHARRSGNWRRDQELFFSSTRLQPRICGSR